MDCPNNSAIWVSRTFVMAPCVQGISSSKLILRINAFIIACVSADLPFEGYWLLPVQRELALRAPFPSFPDNYVLHYFSVNRLASWARKEEQKEMNLTSKSLEFCESV